MEKQSTRKLFMLVIAVVSMFLLCMSAFMLTSCGEEQVEHTHDYTYNVTSTNATCGSAGLKVSQCECGQFQAEAVPVKGDHKFSDGYCTVCGISETADNAEVLAAIKKANVSAASIAEAVQTALNDQLNKADDSAELKTLTENVGTLKTKLEALQAKADTLATKADTATQAQLNEVKAQITEVNTALTNAQNALSAKIDEVMKAIHNHEWTKGKVVAPTCRTVGFTVYTCTCGSVQTSDYVDALGGEHKFENSQVTKEPDCIHTGIKVWYCSSCSATYQEMIPVSGHKYAVSAEKSVGITVKANGTYTLNDCTQGAHVVEACSVCGVEKDPQDIAAKEAHVWDEGTVTTPATCGSDGEKLLSCTVCTQTKTETISSTSAHVWNDGEVKTAATCTEKGSKIFTCTVCSETEEKEYGPLGHVDSGKTETYYTNVKINEQGTVVTADVSEVFEGLTAYVGTAEETTYKICSVCKELYSPDPKAPGMHLFVIDVTRTNEDANEEDGTPIIRAATAEDDEESVKYGYINVSCTEVGYVWFYCIDETCCVVEDGEVTNKKVTPKMPLDPRGHVYEWEITTDAGCGVAGEKVGICKYCEDEKNETIPALEHNYVWVETTPAVCGVAGLETGTCSNCGDVTTREIPALEHVWGEWTVKTAANCSAAGEEIRVCDRCKKEESREIPANGQHDYSIPLDEEGKPTIENRYGFEFGYIYNPETGKIDLPCWTTAGCDRSGVVVNYCNICGDFEITNTYVPMLGHDYSIIKTIEGDCVSGIYVTFACSRCGVTYSNTIQSPTGHDLVFVPAVEATCTTVGHDAFAYCKVCHKVLVDPEGNMTQENVEVANGKYSRWSDYKTDADGKPCMYYDPTTTIEAELAANAATLEVLGTPATGHKFTKSVPLTTEDCISSGWTITVCEKCGFAEDGKTVTILADAEGYEADETLYTALTIAIENYVPTDAEKTALVNAINALLPVDGSITAFDYDTLAELLAGYNFTAITYVKETGHSYGNYVECVGIDSIKDVATYIEYVRENYKDLTLTDEDLTTIWNAVEWEGHENEVAAVCSKCAEILPAIGHNVEYYAYKLTTKDGQLLDWSVVEGILAANYDATTKTYNATAIQKALSEDALWSQAGMNKWVKVGSQKQANNDDLAVKPEAPAAENETPNYYVFTLDQIKALGFYNATQEAVNCYFKAFCANECGLDMGWNKQHTYPVSENHDKYPNCYDFGYCVWCDTQLLAIGGNHVLTAVEDLTAAQKATLETLDWYIEAMAKAKEADCTNVGNKVTVEVCYSCLDALALGKEITWSNTNRTITEEEIPAKGHVWEVGGTYPEDPDCLVGFYYYDVCTVCKVTRIETEEAKVTRVPEGEHDKAYYVTDVNGYYGFSGVKSHKVAPVENYFNTDNYIPATAEKTAYMSYICLECGTPVQGYYDDAKYTENNLLYYTMASDEDIAIYTAAGSEFGKVQSARPEDRGIVVAYDDNTLTGLKDLAKPYIYIEANKDVEITADLVLATGDDGKLITKNITFDLNGNTFKYNRPVETVNGKQVRYSMRIEDYTLSIINGKIESVMSGNTATFYLNNSTSHLYLENVKAENLNASIAMSGNSKDATGNRYPAVGSVTIVNSVIKTTAPFGFATNASFAKTDSEAQQKSNVDITIENSKIIAAETAVLLNVPGTVVIKGSKLEGSWQGMVLRGGQIHATVEDTTICLTAKVGVDGNVNRDGAGDYVTNGWGQGNQVPCYAITVGNYGVAPDYTTGYLDGETTLALKNVEVYVEKTLDQVEAEKAAAAAAEGTETPAPAETPANTCYVGAKPGLTVAITVENCEGVVFEVAEYGDETAGKGVVTVTYTESTPVVDNYPATPATPAE